MMEFSIIKMDDTLKVYFYKLGFVGWFSLYMQMKHINLFVPSKSVPLGLLSTKIK